MKLGYVGDSSYRTVIEHCKEVALGVNEDTEAVIVESSMIEGPRDLPLLNTNLAVRNLISTPALQAEFHQVLGLVEGFAVTYLYGFMSKERLGDLLEMTYSTRFLAGEIGSQLGFVQGTGLACSSDTKMAVRQLTEVEGMLQSMKYRGEILLGVTRDYQICSLQFGHFTGGFALFTELATANPQAFYEWCLGEEEEPHLYEQSVSVCTLLSYPPFPYNTEVGFSIKAPSGAERHLYRMSIDRCEVAYSATWGKDIFEAMRRCRKTIDNCRAYNKEIQYRIDFGRRQKFLLNQEKWLSLGGE